MVDIAAQLSLTPSGLAIDPAVILGAETADSHAFGNILAGQIAGSLGANPESGAPASPLPPLPIPAGDRQLGGKILPGAAQILPDAAPLGLEAPAAQVLPSIAATPAMRLVNVASFTKFKPQADTETTEAGAPEPKQAEASPVHGLIKMLTAALKGQRPTAQLSADQLSADQAAADLPAADLMVAEDASAAPTATGAGVGAAELAVAIASPALTMLQFALPIPAVPTPAGPQTVASAAPRAMPGDAAPILISNAARQADADLRDQIRPALAQFLTQPVQARPSAAASFASTAPSAAGAAAAPTIPVLTVAAAASDTPIPAITLVSAAALPVGQSVSARIQVAAADGKDVSASLPDRQAADRPVAIQPSLAGRDVTSGAPIVADRAAPAVRAVLAERAAPDRITTPAIADSQAPLAAAAPVTSAPVTMAPVVELPRHDFAALVDRLVEARNAAVPQSTNALLNHAEFGQVSLHFQQDGDDLKVAMSSADPDFARAAQAAQAATPVERQNFNADTNSRGQSPSQSQTANNASQSQHEAAGRGAERSDQQNRNGQGRNSRGGNNPSNPSPRWADRDQPQTRGGIFA